MYEEMVKRQQREREAESSAAAVVLVECCIYVVGRRFSRARTGTTPQELGNTCYTRIICNMEGKV